MLDTHRRKALMTFRKRATAIEAQETARQLEQANYTESLRGIQRPRARQEGTEASGQPMDKLTFHQCKKVRTFQEEAAQPKVPRFNAWESREDNVVRLEQPKEGEKAENKAAQVGVNDSETEPKEALRSRAERSSEGEEPPTPSTRREAVREVALSGKVIRKAEAVQLEQWEAAREAKETLAPTGTTGIETEPNEVPRSRAKGSSEGKESRAAGTRADSSRTALGKPDYGPDMVGGGTKPTQALRSWTARRKEEQEPLGSKEDEPTAKRNRVGTTASWTVAPESDEKGRADGMRGYLSAAPTTPVSRAATQYPGPLLFVIETATMEVYPHIEPMAMENLLQGLDAVVWNDRHLWQITTIEEWRRRAARGNLDHLGRAVAEHVGRYGGHFDWVSWQGPPSTHMARIIVENTVQALKREYQQQYPPVYDQPPRRRPGTETANKARRPRN